MPTPESEHRTTVEETEPGHWQVICSCGYTGRLRSNKFDAGEDEIAHQDTGAGPRNREQMRIYREEFPKWISGRRTSASQSRRSSEGGDDDRCPG